MFACVYVYTSLCQLPDPWRVIYEATAHRFRDTGRYAQSVVQNMHGRMHTSTSLPVDLPVSDQQHQTHFPAYPWPRCVSDISPTAPLFTACHFVKPTRLMERAASPNMYTTTWRCLRYFFWASASGHPIDMGASQLYLIVPQNGHVHANLLHNALSWEHQTPTRTLFFPPLFLFACTHATTPDLAPHCNAPNRTLKKEGGSACARKHRCGRLTAGFEVWSPGCLTEAAWSLFAPTKNS